MPRRFATYRLQLSPDFDFDDATQAIPDIARLGISHLYLSPVAEAVTGSAHGYDVVEPHSVRAALGGRDGLWTLARAARMHGLGVVVDIVPNHVSTAEPYRNRWWWAVLRGGPRAPSATYFDIEWEAGGGKVLVPVLGRSLADVLTDGELGIDVASDEPCVRYHDRRFPLRPGSFGVADDPTDPSVVESVLERQHYRLIHWRNPARNVRRFFTIDDLAAVRPEEPAVADAVHRTVAELRHDGLADGVRVDHVDGLADPAAYLEVLRAALGPEAWILVEKILVGDEQLPAGWRVDGTTGYEWISLVDHLFTHPAAQDDFPVVSGAGAAPHRSYHAEERLGVREVLDEALRPDLDRVVRAAVRVLGDGSAPHDDLAAAVIALTVHLGRYRTYLGTVGEVSIAGPDGASSPSGDASEFAVLRAAAERAARDLDGDGATALHLLVDAISAHTELTRRWQQLTGPALAKGGEDRALFRWIRLVAHNEVGGDPAGWTASLDGFHAHNRAIAGATPHTLLAGSTHDTKRSEDVRARVLALTERPGSWSQAVESWASEVRAAAARGAPRTADDDWSMVLAFQTAVGAWPIDAVRLGDHLVKAAREASVRTSWTDPDDRHERALRALADLLTEGPVAASIEAFVGELEPAARSISLAQLVLRLTAPGVPDIYQGGESWLHTLVDPDNRRPLHPEALRAAVDGAAAAAEVWTASHPKAAVVHRVLSVRRRHAECFGSGGGYEVLTVDGEYRDHVIAFVRPGPAEQTSHGVVTVASRFGASRPSGWHDTSVFLPPGNWTDALRPNGRSVTDVVALSELLGDGPACRPAAVLEPPR